MDVEVQILSCAHILSVRIAPMGNTHFLNGRLVSEEELLISPRDLGYTRGYAVFDFLRTYEHHRPFKVNEHIDRLFSSAEQIHLSMPWKKEEIIGWIQETLNANDSLDEKFIKIIVSGGVASAMVPEKESTIIILVDSAVEYPRECYEQGINVIATKFTRYHATAKTNNYIEGIKQMQIGAAMNAAEPLYYSDTQVFEGSNSNVFALIDGKVMTPKTNVLEGVTRGVLLDLLKLDFPVVEEDFSFEELQSASEIFFSASGKEITPITSINAELVGDGTVGPVTKEVMKQYHDYVHSNLW